MGRDSGAAHSSIALLQERFRQLQRAKEMREEREHRSRGGGGQGERQPQWFLLHPELVRPSRPLHAHRALLHRELDAERTGLPACGATVSTGLWSERPTVRSVSGSDAMDVDTSLHL